MARERYVAVARRASRGGPAAARRLSAAHAAFIRTMLRLGHPDLALDAGHALLMACPECPRSRALVQRLRSQVIRLGPKENEEGAYEALKSHISIAFVQRLKLDAEAPTL